MKNSDLLKTLKSKIECFVPSSGLLTGLMIVELPTGLAMSELPTGLHLMVVLLTTQRLN